MRTRITLFLVVGLIAASQSGNIVRLGEAHPVAIAAWRLLLASLFFVPLGAGRIAEVLRLPRRDQAMLLLTGAVLATHFFTWIAAIQMTTVANAASLLAVAPVIAAVGGLLLYGERYGLRFLASLLCGVGGVVTIGLGDAGYASGHLVGDGVAVICAVLFAIYLLLGRRLRPHLATAPYVLSIYGVAALVSFACLLLLQQPLVDYSGRTWLCFLLMALVPTIVGHTAINASLRYFDAGRIAVATLAEPPLAALVAALAWGEQITAHGAAGFGLIAASVLLLVWEQARGSAPRSARA